MVGSAGRGVGMGKTWCWVPCGGMGSLPDDGRPPAPAQENGIGHHGDEDGEAWFDALENAFEVDHSNQAGSGTWDECRRGSAAEAGIYLSRVDTDSATYTVAHTSHPKVSYRHVKGTTVHSVLLDMELDYPVDRVWAMGWEFEYLDTWNPFAIEPTVLDNDGDRTLVLYFAVWLPWPFHPRENYIHVKWSDALDEHGCFFVTLHDIEFENKLAESYGGGSKERPSKKKKKRERASILKGSSAWVWPVREGGGGKSRVLFSVHADPLVFSPPNWLVNFVLKLMAPTIYKALQKALHKVYVEDPHSPYARRVQEKELYHTMRERLCQVGA